MAVKIVRACEGKLGFLGSIGVRFMLDGTDAGNRFSLVEHPMSPGALAAPLHRHTREDEYTYVLRGRVGALLGEEVVLGNPGDLVSSHATNGTHSGTRAMSRRASLRLFRPPVSSAFFCELSDLGGIARLQPDVAAELCSRYALDMASESVPDLVQRFNLRFPGEPCF
jgi:mannose-6-phosphate isomerase-like protein (cupin superfamily)